MDTRSAPRFTIFICRTVPQFNYNFLTQFNEEKGYQGITTKSSSFKIQEVMSNVAITEKTGKHARQFIYANQWLLPTKVTSDINFSDKSVV